MDDSTGCRRALPDRWQVPEWMAAGTLDLPKWEAGQRLMRAAAPDAFANIEAGDRIITANRVVMEACRKQANKAKASVRCMISVEAEKTP